LSAPPTATWHWCLGQRLTREGLMPADGGPPQLCLALVNLIQRLQHAPGAYVQPPPEDLDLADHEIVLATHSGPVGCHQDVTAAGFTARRARTTSGRLSVTTAQAGNGSTSLVQ